MSQTSWFSTGDKEAQSSYPRAMVNRDWTDAENDLIVADYFAMLAEDMAGRPYNKAQHRRELMPLLRDRTNGSVEFKHQNISAVLKGIGESWIPGYKPAFNFQMPLVDAVARWLALNPAWLGRQPDAPPLTGLAPSRWRCHLVRSRRTSFSRAISFLSPLSPVEC